MKFVVEERIKKKKKKKREEKKKDIKCLKSGFQSYTYVSCFVFITSGCFLSLSLSFISFLSFFFFSFTTIHIMRIMYNDAIKRRRERRNVLGGIFV